MIVCICNDIPYNVIANILKRTKSKTIEELQTHIGICDRCEGCTYMIENMIERNNENLLTDSWLFDSSGDA